MPTRLHTALPPRRQKLQTAKTDDNLFMPLRFLIVHTNKKTTPTIYCSLSMHAKALFSTPLCQILDTPVIESNAANYLQLNLGASWTRPLCWVYCTPARTCISIVEGVVWFFFFLASLGIASITQGDDVVHN